MIKARSFRTGVFWAAVISASVAAAGAFAADAEEGARIYQRWCVNCHGSLTSTTATDMAPPLALLLRDKTLTPEALRVWLANPHPPMPNLSLGRAEIDDVIAYLQTLKTR